MSAYYFCQVHQLHIYYWCAKVSGALAVSSVVRSTAAISTILYFGGGAASVIEFSDLSMITIIKPHSHHSRHCLNVQKLHTLYFHLLLTLRFAAISDQHLIDSIYRWLLLSKFFFRLFRIRWCQQKSKLYNG